MLVHDLRGADLRGAQLAGAQMEGATFASAERAGAPLEGGIVADPRGRKPRLTLHPCPACAAAVGEPCRSASGKVLPNGHGARRALAGLPARGDRARAIARLALEGGGDPVAALREIAGSGLP